jgi:hypothetical protein
MSTVTFALSSDGLGQVPVRDSMNDFEFIVGVATYCCPSFVADFLSPRIASLHASDDTVSSFVIETEDRSHIFPEFLSLGRGRRLTLTDANRPFLSSIARELENSELYGHVLKSAEGDISIENVIRRMKMLDEMSANYAPEIEFAASHFAEIPQSDIPDMSFETFQEVVRHKKLKIESEDSLYEIVSKGISADFRYFELLDIIQFEFLSTDCFRNYFELVSESFEHFSISHWAALRSRLLLPVDPKSSNDRLLLPSLSCAPSSALPGIIAHLTCRFGGNVHERGVVGITANRPVNAESCNAPKNLADLGTDSYFHSVNEPNQSVCYDFNEMKVRPTHYSVRMYPTGRNSYHLKNWVIEGSTDGASWSEIDRREKNTDLNSSLAIKTFEVAKIATFRMIRLRQIGQNHRGDHYLIFTSFELFGSLIGLKPK